MIKVKNCYACPFREQCKNRDGVDNAYGGLECGKIWKESSVKNGQIDDLVSLPKEIEAYKQGIRALESAIDRAEKGLEIYKGEESQELRKAIIKWYTRAKNIIEENRKMYLKTHE